MTRKIVNILLILNITLFACKNNEGNKTEEPSGLPEGKWRGELTLTSQEKLPFIFEIRNNDLGTTFEIINGEEKIFVDEIEINGNDIIVQLPLFDSQIKAKYENKKLTGKWINNARKENNEIPFSAEHAIEKRFNVVSKPNHNITGKWEVGFYDPNDSVPVINKAIGEFQQKGEIITGTFLTTTGDYRFLEGVLDGDILYLSCFDGAHAFLFKAKVAGDRMEGEFWSGTHHYEKWVGERNENATLPDPEKLTALKEGVEKISFTFPDLSGKNISIEDEKFKNKVLIVQILGSWCPNCADETKFLSEIYKRYNSKGLEIIGLCFETTKDFEKASSNVKKMAKDLNAEYTFLIAGTSNKQEASETLPFLNHVISFPTTMFLDKKGNVRKIHTGFNGPATGKHYEKFVSETTAFIEKLLAEK
ncbi:MAG: TlpA disulfide reductase family protein [Bacteroidia bacterium]